MILLADALAVSSNGNVGGGGGNKKQRCTSMSPRTGAILAKAINFCSKIQSNQLQSVIPMKVSPTLRDYRAGGKTIALDC